MMKKIYSLLVVVAFLLVPFAVFAAVDVTLTDTSTQDSKTITIDIDTQTDVLDQVSLPIRFSEGVTISELTAGDIECSTLEYGQDEEINNEIVIRCILQEASALDGILVNILFTATTEDYTFELVENENLDIGTLTLGETVNVGEVIDPELTTQLEEDLPFENEASTIAQDSVVEEAEEGFSLDNITEYLPYILIGGSVILLISIIVILLSKKKEPKDSTPTDTPTKITSPEPPVQNTETEGEPSLRSMVNGVNNTQSQPQVPPQTNTNVQDDSSFTTTPPISTPSTQTPLQQTPPVPPMQPPQQEPPAQRTSSPEIAPSAQQEDLQEILNRESSRTQGQQTVQPTTPETPVEPQAQIPPQPSTQPTTQEVPFSGDFNVGNTQDTAPQIETPTVGSNDNLQSQVNNEINNLNTQNPLPSPENQTPDISTEYPPVPPSAVQPNTQQQVPPIAETPEELPEVPPTM